MATGFNTQIGSGEYRLQFETDNKEYFLLMQETARRCVDGGHMTNADRIRSMSDEELSEFINTTMTVCDCCVYDGNCVEYANIMKCRKGVLEWLQKPMEVSADNVKES